MNSFKVEAIECILFTLTSDIFPMTLVEEIEAFFGDKGCVLQLQVFIDRTCALTLCSTAAVIKLSQINHIIIGRKKLPFRFCDRKPRRIRVMDVHPKHTLNILDSRMMSYGKVLWSDLERRSNSVCYFAVIDAKKKPPEKVKIRGRECEIVCL